MRGSGKRKKVGGKRYEARSRGLSSPDSLVFEPAKRADVRADYFLGHWERDIIIKIKSPLFDLVLIEVFGRNGAAED